uniref:Retrotransposon gag domain-containing protein n=1 Tax=Cannabis sativa TaxID=3483 RepID=A0A803NX36_CANSA
MASSSADAAAHQSVVPTTMFVPPLRLNRNKYFFLRSQVLPAIRALDLEGILLNQNRPQPRIYQPPESTTMVSNPEFNRWMRLDHFLISWPMSTISESMIGHVVNCATASEIWSTLEQIFRTASRARQIHLMNQLQSTKKGSLAINKYLLKMKNLPDGLRAAGNQITEEQLILYILAGLGTKPNNLS